MTTPTADVDRDVDRDLDRDRDLMGRDGPILVVLATALWIAALVHHVDDLIAEDHVGSAGAVTLRTTVLLAVQLVAIVLVRENRAVGDVVLGVVALWWFATVFVAHVASITRPVDEIAIAEPAGWAPVFIAAVFVGGSTSLTIVALCTRRLFQRVATRPDGRNA